MAALAVAQTASAGRIEVLSSPLSDFVIFSNGGVTYDQWDDYETEIRGHTNITGDVGSNQDFYAHGDPLAGYPAQISGSVYAGGYLKFGQNQTVGSSSQSEEVVVNGANSLTGSSNRDEAIIGGMGGTPPLGAAPSTAICTRRAT
jgi:hypothetical protein